MSPADLNKLIFQVSTITIFFLYIISITNSQVIVTEHTGFVQNLITPDYALSPPETVTKVYSA